MWATLCQTLNASTSRAEAAALGWGGSPPLRRSPRRTGFGDGRAVEGKNFPRDEKLVISLLDLRNEMG